MEYQTQPSTPPALHDPLSIEPETISIFAHELRTNLAALKWLLKMFIDGDVGVLTPEQLTLLKRASSANDRMVDLVDELLNLSTIGEDRTPKPINIISLIDDVLFDFTAESYERDVEVLFLRPEAPMPNVLAEKTRIRFIIQNLIENALKYSREGGKVFVALAHDATSVTLSVRDTGIGIPENEQGHIFEKYFRASNAKGKESVGTGLGLYISKSVIERSGGSITFETSDHGTTFFLQMPIAA
jgi:signal transduction histidine kinase